MKLAHKIYLAVALALIVGSLYLAAREQTEQLLESHAQILHDFHELERLNVELNNAAWKTAFLLYSDYDMLNDRLDRSRALVQRILNSPVLDGSAYESTRQQVKAYAGLLEARESDYQRFATLNSMIKTSVVYIPRLYQRFLDDFGYADVDYLQHLSRISVAVFLASNTLDGDFLVGVDDSLAALQAQRFEDPEQRDFNEVFVAHTRAILRFLPQYLPVFHGLLDEQADRLLHSANEAFVAASGRQGDRVAMMSLAITVAFFVSIVLIIFFLIRIERKHATTLSLHRQLQSTATTDRLTGLKNRSAMDAELARGGAAPRTLLLLNIDGFRNVNNFFGHAAGDALLAQTAGLLRSVTGEGDGLFRVGGDDFAVVQALSVDEAVPLAQLLLERIEGTAFEYKGNAFPVSVTIGISGQHPLLETADVALKRVKRSRAKYAVYSDDLNIREQVARNLEVLGELRRAIEGDDVLAYYMPIQNLRNDRIERYECLVRIRGSKGRLMMPFEFLEVAKESRLYGQLTIRMIRKAFATFREHTHCDFSINLSIEDINDRDVVGFLFDSVRKEPDVGRRLMLEILESEEVADYEAVREFVQRAKSLGCKVAIDDFGAGYSSLRHLLKLEVDNLKIDASLVRDVDRDVHAKAAVSAIVRLAREMGVPSVTAEFVHSEAVRSTIRAMGIDYAQGFLIGEPKPHLVGDTTLPRTVIRDSA